LKLDNRDKVGEHSRRMNLLLIGPRGSGKTTVGRLLAARRQRPFIDLDDVALASFSNKTIGEVWKAHGEHAWRNAEVAALTDVLSRDGQVIALGGGVPMIDKAKAMLAFQARPREIFVVYLRCTPQILAARLRSAPGDRPSLTGANFIEEIPAVLAAREPTYLDMADVAYDVGTDESAAEVAEGVAECLPPEFHVGG
jgi:shikimate kinase